VPGTGGREPQERLIGSIAFAAMPRVVMIATKIRREDRGASERRVLMRAKSNIGPDGDPKTPKPNSGSCRLALVSEKAPSRSGRFTENPYLLTAPHICSLKSASTYGEGEHVGTPECGPNGREEVEF